MPGKPPVTVTHAHRPKRPPRKRAPAAKIAGPTIVTMRAKPGRFGAVPDLTEEEHRRRSDAADALWRELVRRATGKA
jgi:hypothetical protein